MSNTDESVRSTNGQLSTERIEAVAAELSIPHAEARRLLAKN